MKKQLLVLASPSGGGKSTVARHLLTVFPEFRLSVSATTRKKRPGEEHGKEYFFMSRKEFENIIQEDGFIEYEEIFGNLYGTLKSETANAIKNGEKLLFDIDVKGALSIKKLFPAHTLLIFFSPPSLDILEQRLRQRKTETEEQIATRLSRATMEMSYQKDFDYVIINDNLPQTFKETEEIVRNNFY
jgi:guanylate kinase